MRPTQIVGLVLIVAGVFVLWKRPTVATKKDVLEIGDFKATVDQREAVPSWLGAVSIGAGVLLLFAGSRKP